ncbi:OmpP1/FadL family transporter [Polycladidibacter hongkongensis]|uniref:OmpP1/FadL family transporter n=1 Tax=Polycladidibacter hongkongensis TaxID=1647556 RepID=UPI00082F6BD1|nr:outer membrane protein transport protein [Pseudovibrio hongkongensis]
MKRILAASSLVVLGSTAALAGGYDTQGLGSFSMLFDDSKFAVEGSYTYVDRNVNVKNAKGQLFAGPAGNLDVPGNGVLGPLSGDSSSSMTPNVWTYGLSVKAQIVDNVDCMAKLHNPWIIGEKFSTTWAGRYQIDSTDADSLGIDATCAYKFALGESNNLRVFGGLRTTTIDYLSTTFVNGTVAAGAGIPVPPGRDYLATIDFSSDDLGVGWRAGAAYEIPEYALRAMISYDSAVDVGLAGDRIFGTSRTPGTASITLPESVEIALQSGVAPGWLVGVDAKWMNWSRLSSLKVDFANGDYRIRRLGYSDGWTVRGFVKHKLSEKFGVGASLTWDKGIGGAYSDTYAIGSGVSYDLNEKATVSLGGSAIYKTASKNNKIVIDSKSRGTESTSTTTYDYDGSWNFAVNSKLKLKF